MKQRGTIACVEASVIVLMSIQAEARKLKPIESAVVKVVAVVSSPVYDQPWQSGTQDIQTGSGVVIDGGKVLTNAHTAASIN